MQIVTVKVRNTWYGMTHLVMSVVNESSTGCSHSKL